MQIYTPETLHCCTATRRVSDHLSPSTKLEQIRGIVYASMVTVFAGSLLQQNHCLLGERGLHGVKETMAMNLSHTSHICVRILWLSCSIHHCRGVVSALTDIGVLPPYSPDLNLIEEALSKVKTGLEPYIEDTETAVIVTTLQLHMTVEAGSPIVKTKSLIDASILCFCSIYSASLRIPSSKSW